MLVAEGIEISPRSVRLEVAEWKRQRREVFVPLVYKPGDLAEVDFFEVVVDVDGQRQKAWMFLMRLMHSGRDFAWIYPRQDQVCFLDGHVRAFAHFGAVPQRLIYDNLKAAVTKVLVGSERQLSQRFLAMATHYNLEASFARPRTGHDKGGVEATGEGNSLAASGADSFWARFVAYQPAIGCRFGLRQCESSKRRRKDCNGTIHD